MIENGPDLIDKLKREKGYTWKSLACTSGISKVTLVNVHSGKSNGSAGTLSCLQRLYYGDAYQALPSDHDYAEPTHATNKADDQPPKYFTHNGEIYPGTYPEDLPSDIPEDEETCTSDVPERLPEKASTPVAQSDESDLKEKYGPVGYAFYKWGNAVWERCTNEERQSISTLFHTLLSLASSEQYHVYACLKDILSSCPTIERCIEGWQNAMDSVPDATISQAKRVVASAIARVQNAPVSGRIARSAMKPLHPGLVRVTGVVRFCAVCSGVINDSVYAGSLWQGSGYAHFHEPCLSRVRFTKR